MSLYTTRGSRVYAPGGGRRAKVVLRPPGRTCRAEGCATILSMYNPAEYCGVHEGRDAQRQKRRRRRPELPRLECVCPYCGDVFETANPRRRFCSDACRIASWQRRQKVATG